MNIADSVRAVMADQLAATPPMILTATITALSIFVFSDAVLKKSQTYHDLENKLMCFLGSLCRLTVMAFLRIVTIAISGIPNKEI